MFLNLGPGGPQTAYVFVPPQLQSKNLDCLGVPCTGLRDTDQQGQGLKYWLKYLEFYGFFLVCFYVMINVRLHIDLCFHYYNHL